LNYSNPRLVVAARAKGAVRNLTARMRLKGQEPTWLNLSTTADQFARPTPGDGLSDAERAAFGPTARLLERKFGGLQMRAILTANPATLTIVDL
jgi:hypothetical protein